MLGRLGLSAALVMLIAAIVIPTGGASAPIHHRGDLRCADIEV
jgi:hypothetical protein